MPNIKQLTDFESQKIAAGQVIERPANVVKELLENALDAQATHISIAIQDGGRKLIRVTDNGIGMDPEDAQICFHKHATSKITTIDELPSLVSFGFRGEALASIAAVSHVTLRTKQAGSIEGTTATVKEGSITLKPSACNQGTDITVQNLFYNVPARAKFLKKRETETRHIIQTVKAMCLAYPHLHLELWIDDKQLFNCPAQDTVIGRYTQLWDMQTAQHMIAIDAIKSPKGIALWGTISNHQWFRYDRSGIFLLVNNRWITNQHLSRAILKGYNNVIPFGRYPMATIAIMINPALIDINCHPRKEEIIFANPRIIEQLIYETVHTALEKHVSKQIKREITFESSSAPSSFFPATSITLEDRLVPSQKSAAIFSSEMQEPPSPQVVSPSSVITDQEEPSLSILEKDEQLHTIIGQFNKTYIILQKDDGLYLIDQHAAHERILYEQFGSNFESVEPINLMFPQLINCSDDDLTLIDPHLTFFAQYGITIEPFGKNQLIIQSTPVHLKDAPLKDLIFQLIGWIKQEDSITLKELPDRIHKKMRAQMACKAAVKAGDALTLEQMKELINNLHTTANRFSCPHGRPTGWLLPLVEIERKFQRR